MRAALALGILVALAAPAAAQQVEADRFFVDKDDEDTDETLWQGSLTSSTFLFRESGGLGTAVVDGGPQVDNASPYRRLFTDLRAQIDGRHLRGGRWDLRVDGRARVANDPADPTPLPGVPNQTQDNRVQSGAFGGNEYELRELYLVRSGRRTDLFVGRQTVADLAAIKIDGVRLDYAASTRWTYLGMVGLYPLRGSRSVTTDYPTASDRGADKVRPLPIAGGFVGAYRTQRAYGAVGAVTIVTPQRDPGLADSEATQYLSRLFLTANGYWRRSPSLDVYHFGVLDLAGDAGFAVTNATVGVQWKPRARLRTNLSANRVDAEVLTIQIRDRFEDADPVTGAVLNNVEAQRIASDSVRATVSGAFGNTNRFEVTTGLTGRRRPEVTLTDNIGATPMTRVLPAAQSVEFLAQAVDRRFYGGVRLDLLYTRTVGIGDSSYARSTGQLFRLGARKETGDGRTELQGDVALVQTADDQQGQACPVATPRFCYGSSNTTGLQANAIGYHRFRKDWYGMGSVGVASQKMTVTNAGGTAVPQSTTVSTTAFLRLGYRF